ncbi:uncharacterized protein LOC100115491 isoform X2 [Nasonia vitripennis]|uniref:Cerebellar degeneration-related protein 2-like n=1 Tax=Nasonia vitripennis TaxID=7425 RepID=A0A7M7HDS8_NASVI|nr:uncharacterized protein LOC100115491 isoform X2 [Nasonia vitripennis]
MSLLSSSIGRVRCLADEEADHNMLQDLQLAAELGKTLLERNKELENCIKIHQCTIDDQAQEIEYMKKQTAALREVNDSRLKIYEQLEVSIQDLERANHRLALENANDKKQIKSQCSTIDTLEARVDELQKKCDDLNKRQEALLREQQARNELSVAKASAAPSAQVNLARTAPTRDGSTQNMAVSPRRISPDMQEAQVQQPATAMASEEDVTKLLQQLQEARSQRAREQRKVAELSEQMDAILQEHAHMEEQLGHWKSKAEDMKNLQDEINTLEEVRQGHLCGRCLRGTDSRAQDELSVMLDQEDDEVSLAESFAESLRDVDSTLQELSSKSELVEEESGNPYRVLVEKYEALLKVQQHLACQRRKPSSASAAAPGPAAPAVAAAVAAAAAMSLQEELQMSGEFGAFSSGHEAQRARRPRKPFAGTPTDFSEAETTSSSGFSDETSNKATQTEGRPGSFLCSIADGEDCKFSIYDDSSTFDGRFHQTPEYRKLFSEIFEVLKRAAVAKDEGTQLPLLGDDSPTSASGLLTPKAGNCDGSMLSVLEDAPSEMTDDTRSIVSLAVSEPVFRVHTPVLVAPSRKQHQEEACRNGGGDHCHDATRATPEGRKPAPLHGNTRRQPLEYLSVQVRKKTSAKKSRRLQSGGETSPGAAADVIPTPNPRVVQLRSGSRRRFRPLQASDVTDGFVWNGNTTHFYPSKSPRARQQQQQQQQHPGSATEAGTESYKRGTASEEVAKLRRLEMSYAEVLRMPNKSKGSGGDGGSRHRKNDYHQ